MKRTSTTVSAIGPSIWVPVDTGQNEFVVGFNVDLDSTSVGITFKIEHTFDDLARVVTGTISRTGTTVTVTTNLAHGLNTGDSLVVLNANSLMGTTGLDGTFAVTVTGATTLTYTSAVSGSVTAGSTQVQYTPIRVQPNATITAATASTDGSYTFPITALRLNVTAWTTPGTATLSVIQGGK
jgi:hypothetical protein